MQLYGVTMYDEWVLLPFRQDWVKLDYQY